jgi:N-acetylneuraminate synthase
MKINGREIGIEYPPYVIAEMSANHNGKLENALKIIEKAHMCGAHAIKIQTYRPDTITLDCNNDDFIINGGIWDGKTLYELYEEAHTPWDWHKPMFDFANDLGITIFSSPFDTSAVDLLEDLNAPAYKVASFEVVDLNLIKYIASTKKPMIISTGMANEEEIQQAISAAKESGCKELAILHCVSGYPAPAEDYNLRTITDMINRFGLLTGLSDHTLENTCALTSVALGACIIEKHFTLDRTRGGPDDSFSLEPNELTSLCKDLHTSWKSLGKVNYDIKPSEKANLKFRRSLYFVKNMNAGDEITSDCIRSVRPGFGLSPKEFDLVVGRKVVRAVKHNTPVTISDIS